MIDLTGRTALVIGSASGMGAAMATRLAAAGAAVIVHGRTESQVEQACRRLTETVPGAEVRRRR
ncbi:SDR family NAD(P)-dependent oxidoreductase [Nonomuraea sp. NPDC049784]|uniref:SDR family NAD(P)-dependent oxidoreductase n=1 Tax=Nonomuraea sp. NPDC049784 TaxID=3154361 RepID=UPI0033EC4081